jgi:hypothetical protein
MALIGVFFDYLLTGVTAKADGALLTRAEFHQLADVPPVVEWFAVLITLTRAAPIKRYPKRLHAADRHYRPGRF